MKKPMNNEEAMRYIDSVEKQYKLWQEVLDLWSECDLFDEAIRGYFDISSQKMLKKKKKVLEARKAGKSPDEIGKDYWDILELFDKSEVEDGHTCIVGGWEYDPRKYKQK
jgi:hypothetical protein